MNPISSINMFRPASVQLDTVTQTQQKKVNEAERKKAEQAQQTTLLEAPAAEYTPGVESGATAKYRGGQNEAGNRKVFVDPVTVPGTFAAKIAEEQAEKEDDHGIQVAERIERVTQAKAMADRIGSPAERQEPTAGNGFMTQTIVPVMNTNTTEETPAEEALDPAVQNAPPVETAQLDPQLAQSVDVKDTITQPLRASEREEPVPRSPRSVARRERPEISPAPRTPREVNPIERAEKQEPQGVEPIGGTEAQEPQAVDAGTQQAQAANVVGGTEPPQPQAVGAIGGNGTQEPPVVGTEPPRTQAAEQVGGSGTPQPQVSDAPRQPQVGGTGPQPQIGDTPRQPRAVGQTGNNGNINPQTAQAVNQIGTGAQKTGAAGETETGVQKAAQAEKDKKAEQAEKVKKDEKAQQEQKTQRKEQAEKDERAQKARKAEELKKKRTAAAKKIKQDIQRLKAQIVREQNPKTAEELSIQLVQMNAKLRQANPGEQVSLLFK